MQETEHLRASSGGRDERTEAQGGRVKVPSQSRKQEQEQIEALLQREADLVEVATQRLRSLGIAIPTATETR